jgi:hypothetical protein
MDKEQEERKVSVKLDQKSLGYLGPIGARFKNPNKPLKEIMQEAITAYNWLTRWSEEGYKIFAIKKGDPTARQLDMSALETLRQLHKKE